MSICIYVFVYCILKVPSDQLTDKNTVLLSWLPPPVPVPVVLYHNNGFYQQFIVADTNIIDKGNE